MLHEDITENFIMNVYQSCGKGHITCNSNHMHNDNTIVIESDLIDYKKVDTQGNMINIMFNTKCDIKPRGIIPVKVLIYEQLRTTTYTYYKHVYQDNTYKSEIITEQEYDDLYAQVTNFDNDSDDSDDEFYDNFSYDKFGYDIYKVDDLHRISRNSSTNLELGKLLFESILYLHYELFQILYPIFKIPRYILDLVSIETNCEYRLEANNYYLYELDRNSSNPEYYPGFKINTINTDNLNVHIICCHDKTQKDVLCCSRIERLELRFSYIHPNLEQIKIRCVHRRYYQFVNGNKVLRYST